jgi:hypothetical protein
VAFEASFDASAIVSLEKWHLARKRFTEDGAHPPAFLGGMLFADVFNAFSMSGIP